MEYKYVLDAHVTTINIYCMFMYIFIYEGKKGQNSAGQKVAAVRGAEVLQTHGFQLTHRGASCSYILTSNLLHSYIISASQVLSHPYVSKTTEDHHRTERETPRVMS